MRIAFLFLTALIAFGQSPLDPRAVKGFDHFYNLEYDQALSEFQKLATADPGNPNFQNHVAQVVLYREMLRGGALESELVSGTNPFIKREKLAASEEAQKQFDQYINRAMELANARVAKDPKDLLALYSLGVSYGLRANYNFLVKKAWMDSLKDATQARKAHNHVAELDPNFVDARLVQGLHDYILGSLPFHIKILGFLAGFHGDRDSGLQSLRLVAQKGKINEYDAQVLLAVIYRREKKPEEALALLNGLINRFPRNYLFRLETVQMYSDLGDKGKALEALDKIEQLKRSGSAGYSSMPIEKVYFYRGNLLFWYKDFDRALDQMKRATNGAANLDAHTAVLAWMRLGQINDLIGQRKDAVNAYQKAIQVAPQSDVAKESRSYLSSPYRGG